MSNTGGFGGGDYQTPQSRTLSTIAETPNPDAADYADASKVAQILQTHGVQLKALAQGQQQLQQGVNDATANPIQQIQQFIADVIVLLGGGELTAGALNFGELQYILPALGAMLGLGDAPFPIDLFQAAEKFFFGYVVPNQAFTDEINTIISNWLSLIGIDPKFIKDLRALVTAIGELFGEVGNLFPSLNSLLSELGISGNDLGPLGQLLAPIIKFFSGIDLTKIGTLLEFITDAIDPFIVQLTAVINFINGVLAVLGFDLAGGGGVTNSPLPQLTQPIENIMAFLGNINFGSTHFDPVAAVTNFITNVLSPTGLVLGPNSPLNPAQLAQNLWPLGIFPDADSIIGSDVWAFDPDVTRTADSSGSLRVTADGTIKAIHGVPSTVVAAQQVEPSVFVQWENYVGTNASIQLQIKQYYRVGDTVTFVGVTTVATLGPTTAAGGWAELTGTYTAPQDGSVNEIRGRLVVTESATGGTIRFDDAAATNKLLPTWVSGLPEALQDLIARLQAIINTVTNVLTGGTSLTNTLQDLAESLGLIPPDNVQGAAGPATIFGSIFGVIDAFLSGSVGAPGSTGGSLADVTNVAGQVASNAYLGGEAWRIANILNNTPVARGMLPTGRANYDITSANTFLATTQSASLSSNFAMLQAMPIGAFSWYGYGSSGITEFYLNVRKTNPATGVRDLVYHSANIVANLQPGSSPADADWMFCEIPAAIATLATDNYYVEWVPVGGTHYIRGMSFTDTIKDHPLAAAPCVGTVVDYSSGPGSPATSLPKATAGPGVPWVEYAVSLSGAADHREPQIEDLEFDGQTIPIPSWCNRLDLIPLGRGGEGHAGTLPGVNGQPGQPASFAPITFERDVHWTGDGTLVTFNILEDGSAMLSIPDYSTTSARGDDGQGAQFGLTPVGKGPGILDYNGQQYTGGVDQKAWGGAGADPGGGGNGGRGLAFQAGGPGGKPYGWVCFRQSEVDGESSGGDTTPPNVEGLDVDVETTANTLTLTVTGAVDE